MSKKSKSIDLLILFIRRIITGSKVLTQTHVSSQAIARCSQDDLKKKNTEMSIMGVFSKNNFKERIKKRKGDVEMFSWFCV